MRSTPGRHMTPPTSTSSAVCCRSPWWRSARTGALTSFHTLGTWARLAEELDGWRCRVFQRDQGPPLIESFLYLGRAKRIPVYAFYDQRRYLQTWWSGRSAAAERTVEEWLAGRTFAELDKTEAREIGRRFDDGYRQRFRRANFVEIKTLLGACFHLE